MSQLDTVAARRGARPVNGTRVDFAAVAALVLSYARHILPRWFPAFAAYGAEATGDHAKAKALWQPVAREKRAIAERETVA